MKPSVENCMQWVKRDKKVIAPCSHLSYFPLVVAEAKQDMVYDEDGNGYIDFLSSASSLNLGSGQPAVHAAVMDQMGKGTQYTIAYSYNRASIEYAERLTSVYPGGAAAKVCFGLCGSDSNDAAVKFARAYTGRPKIITFLNGYHGSTYGAASLTAVSARTRRGMGPFLPEVYSFPFFDTSVEDAACERDCVRMIEEAFAAYLPPEEVAAVIIEPIQGDAGLLAAHPIFLQKLYALCRKHGILFIAEEVQQAFFRTGKWFSIEHYGIVPDGIVLGKALGAGLPLGAFMARSEIIDALTARAQEGIWGYTAPPVYLGRKRLGLPRRYCGFRLYVYGGIPAASGGKHAADAAVPGGTLPPVSGESDGHLRHGNVPGSCGDTAGARLRPHCSGCRRDVQDTVSGL